MLWFFVDLTASYYLLLYYFCFRGPMNSFFVPFTISLFVNSPSSFSNFFRTCPDMSEYNQNIFVCHESIDCYHFVPIVPRNLKMAFFRKLDSFFKSPNLPKKKFPKNYSELEIWITCLLIWAGISNFKLRIVFLK